MRNISNLSIIIILAMRVLTAGDEPVTSMLSTLKVPEGFSIEVVASPPLFEHPIMASFDDQGRLYVSDSCGVNLPGKELLKNPPHSIRLLESSDGGEHFDKTRLFADKLVFPQGLLWHDGAVYTTSPPSLWKLEDTDGDGICDKRTELVSGLAVTGVSDDAHGTCLGPDGRIYFFPGRMHHNITLKDGTVFKNATGAWVMRCRPDGRDVEIVSGCHGNPVEVDFTPEGDCLLSGTFWAPDSFGGGLRDALIHIVEGGEYPVRDRTYNDRKRTGELLPVLVQMPATAPAGMTLYRGESFGAEFRGNLFCSYFNTHKVMRHILERDGATFRSRNEDFLTSSSSDFHPTDVLEDADGSLLVVDTGGWFRIGCPTSKIAKPEIKGAIYRIRRIDAPKVADARGTTADWTKPAALLNDPRFMVRERAIREVAKKSLSVVSELVELLKKGDIEARLNAVWALTRIDGLDARAAVQTALADKDLSVCQAAVYSAGLHRDAGALPLLTALMKTGTPSIRREAATGLGRIGRSEAIPALLNAVGENPDRFLEHAIIYALIRIKDRAAMIAALHDNRPALCRAALIALDQMDGGDLNAELVVPLLNTGDAEFRRTVMSVIVSHAGWARELIALCTPWIAAESLDNTQRDNLRAILTTLQSGKEAQELIARALRNEKTPAATRVLLLEVIAAAPGEKLPAIWTAELRWSLDSKDEAVVRQSVVAMRTKGITSFDDALASLSRDESRTRELRVEALSAAISRMDNLDRASFELLTASLNKDQPPLLRLAAANALGQARLNESQLSSLARELGEAGPLELPKLLGAYEHATKDSVGKKLVAALEKSAYLQSITGDALRQALKDFPEPIRQSAAPLLAKLDVDAEAQNARLQELSPALTGGDIKHGRQTFFSQKALCSTCHAIQGQGGHVGPDLSKIGSIRNGRDLLEAIVFPSASFARGYEPYVVKLKDGRIFNGIISHETADAIFIYGADRNEVRLARGEIKDIKQTRVSIMPQGLEANFTKAEFADLLSFLQSLK